MTRSAAPGRRRYRPIAQIGRGGMAEVLLTMADAGGGVWRLEVLKRIWPELAADQDFVTMFLDEARLSLRLNHPNVVQTHEVLIGDDELSIAMEYLDGQPLTRILNRLLRGPGALSLPLRLRILTRVLAGLEHAHTLTDFDGKPLGVVHRDVSPQNVFVTYDGQVKLVDFGVAKTLAASHHTRPGAIKGKLAYMAPEQLQCTTVDRRADVFAVGVMLWEMLAARRMWHRMTEVEIVGHLAAGRPMPALPVPSDGSLPVGLDAICARALDTDPDRRFQTAADLEMELEGVLAGAADSHARSLGKVVSMAFATERAERQALIERCVRRNEQRRAAERCGRPERPLAFDVPVERPLAFDVPVDDLQYEQDEQGGEGGEGGQGGQGGQDGQGGQGRMEETPAFLVPPELAARSAAVWWRRAAVVGGAVAAVVALLFVAAGHGARVADRHAAQDAVATVTPRAQEAAPAGARTAAGLAFETIPVAPQNRPSPPAAAAAPKEGERHRRHRRRRATDENTTLPPSDHTDVGRADVSLPRFGQF